MDDTRKARTAMRRLRATPQEFVAALIKLRTTRALAEHFNVSEHTITLERTRLRKAGVPIPVTPAGVNTRAVTPEVVEELTEMLTNAGLAQQAA